jgi:RimJ/RimL family protein N-acetyltransferase
MDLVPITPEYYEFVRLLRTHPETQSGFIVSATITSEDQSAYMEKHSLNYYVCLLYGSPVGYIGVVDGDIRFCTEPDFQGMGIGTFMLLKIKDKYPEAYGQIKKENKSSQHVFDKCGVKYKVI